MYIHNRRWRRSQTIALKISQVWLSEWKLHYCQVWCAFQSDKWYFFYALGKKGNGLGQSQHKCFLLMDTHIVHGYHSRHPCLVQIYTCNLHELTLDWEVAVNALVNMTVFDGKIRAIWVQHWYTYLSLRSGHSVNQSRFYTYRGTYLHFYHLDSWLFRGLFNPIKCK